jgi:hypothetical protein
MYILKEAVRQQKDWFNLYLEEHPYITGHEAFDKIMNKNAELFPDIIDQLYLKLDAIKREDFSFIVAEALDEIVNLSVASDIDIDFKNLSDIKKTFFNILVNECIDVGVEKLIFIKDPSTGIVDLTPKYLKIH